MIPTRPGGPRTEPLEQPRQPVLRVADDRELGLEESADHGRVEIEMDQRLRRLEREIQEQPLRRSMGEAAADGENHVGRLDDRFGGAAVRQHTVPQGIPLADRSPAHDRRDHRRAETARETSQLGVGLGGDHPAAGDEKGPGRGREQSRGLVDRLHVTRRPPAVAAAARRCVEAAGEKVVGDRDRDRPGAAGP